MRADFGELEAGQWRAVREGKVEVLGMKGRFADAFFFRGARVDAEELAASVANNVFLPRNTRTAVCAKEVGLVGRKMAEAKFVVVHCKVAGAESFIVRLAFAADVAGSPATVDEFPFVGVDFDGVPGMGGVFAWDGSVGGEESETETFAMAPNDKAFEAGFAGQGGKEAGVTFADGKAGRESGCWGAGLNGIIEKSNYVVRDVMMEPSEDCAGFIGSGRKWSGEMGC